MELHYLGFSIYRTCPLQYKWRFVAKPPFEFKIDMRNAFIGLAIQRLVEYFYQKKWWKATDPIETMRDHIPTVFAEFIDGKKIWFTPEEVTKWTQVAYDTIPMIVSMIKAERLLSTEVFVEQNGEIPLGEDKLWLRPDLVVVERPAKGETFITMLDGKAGKTVGKYVDVDQLFFYAGWSRYVLGKLPDRLGFWWYRHSKINWFPVTDKAVDDVQTRARIYIAGIKAGKFAPTPGEHCRFCDYFSGCPEGQAHRFTQQESQLADVIIPENGEVGF
jgi:hypothetical protein